MAGEFLLPALSIVTMLMVIGLALWSKRRTENKMEDDESEKSSLAKDGPGKRPIR